MEAERPTQRPGSSPCRPRRWPAGPGLTRDGPSETIIIGGQGHPPTLLTSLTTGGDVPPAPTSLMGQGLGGRLTPASPNHRRRQTWHRLASAPQKSGARKAPR